MDYYSEKVIDTFSREYLIASGVTTPTLQNQFNVDEESPRVNNNTSGMFHYCLTKSLHISTRYQLGIFLAISFLRSIVSCITEQDW